MLVTWDTTPRKLKWKTRILRLKPKTPFLEIRTVIRFHIPLRMEQFLLEGKVVLKAEEWEVMEGVQLNNCLRVHLV